jgi:hypothetical protein
MRIVLSFPLLLVGLSLIFSQQRSGTRAGPCSCDDRIQLLNRLNEVDTAIHAYELAEAEGHGKILSSGGKDSVGDLADLEIKVTSAMRQVGQPGASKILGEIGPFDCRNVLSGQTACLSEVAKKHQTVRQQQCEKRSAQRAAGAAITLEEFAEDEIKAYQAEQKYILSVLQGLTLCKPRTWFGTVSYSVTKKYSSEDNRTYGLKNENKSNSITDRTSVGTGTILFGDATAEQNESVTYAQESSGVDSHQRQCYGPGQPKGYITETDTSKSKQDGGDQATKSLPSLKVNESPAGVATLTFSSLSFTFKAKSITNYHQTGCKETTSPGTPSETNVTVLGEAFKVGGQLSPDGLTFSGNQTNTLRGLIAGSIKVNESVHSASWTLHRLSR